MFKKFIFITTLFFVYSFSTHAFDGSKYSKNAEELCQFLQNHFGGLNPYSMQCAMGAGSGEFTSHESGFCHKLVLEDRINAGTCLTAISRKNSDAKLDECEIQTTEEEILNCLNY